MVDIDRADIQGNILDGYSLACTKHLFLRFLPGRGKAALAAVSGQVSNAKLWDGDPPVSTLNVGVSFAGLQALKLPEEWLMSLPAAFRAGMRGRAAELSDDLSKFDPAWSEPIHLWVWIHAKDADALKLKNDDLQKLLSGSAELVLVLDGTRRRNEAGQQIEHFGFRDGLSQPSLIGSLKPARPGNGVLTQDGGWRPLATGEFLIGHEDETGDVAEAGSLSDFSQNATFAAFRQLEQDVQGFQDYIRKQAEQLSATAEKPVKEDWIAERMVGRRRDGTALGSPEGASSEESINAFNFKNDPEGRTCPLGSHVRRANVRDGEAFAVSFARHRILRRGMTYGELFDPHKEQASRGILFVALNADLERQFEFLQRLYMNDGAAARQGRDVDPLVSSLGGNFVIPGDLESRRDTMICAKVPSFVTCRGGEYFMLPGIRGLEQLQAAAADVAAAPPNYRAQPLPGNSNYVQANGVDQGHEVSS